MADEKYEATASALIPASADRAWEALATSEGFSRLYEGMKVQCDWKVGGPIVWTGEWEGKEFKDTGTLKVYDRPRLFVYTYWTSFWGPEPDADSIQTIRNEFRPVEGGTEVRITQSNIPSAEDRDRYAANWKQLLEKAASSVAAAGA